MDELHLEVAQHWMDYVMKFVQRGKGIKPRWANLVSSVYGIYYIIKYLIKL